jgi:hypothetical protein
MNSPFPDVDTDECSEETTVSDPIPFFQVSTTVMDLRRPVYTRTFGPWLKCAEVFSLASADTSIRSFSRIGAFSTLAITPSPYSMKFGDTQGLGTRRSVLERSRGRRIWQKAEGPDTAEVCAGASLTLVHRDGMLPQVLGTVPLAEAAVAV